ncbi:MAG: hypothetical protein U0796_14630 [Gemmatales bacterium]
MLPARSLACLLLLMGYTACQAQQMRLNPPQFALMINKAVLDELKLSKDQQEGVDSLLSEYTQEVDGQKRLVIRGGADLDSLEQDLLKLLNAKQTKRLREAWLQINGPLALTDEKLAKEVGLSADQSQKAVEAVTDMNAAMREAFHEVQGDQQKMTSEVKRLRQETRVALEKLLTAEQRDKLAKLQGEKIANLLPPDAKEAKKSEKK